MKILPLGIYDVILGVDWLAAHSPMKVDWANKVMTLKEKGEKIVIQGLPDTQVSTQGTLTQQMQMLPTSLGKKSGKLCLNAMVTEQAEQQAVPLEIQSILNEFPEVFAEPTGLPSRRACDHQIPLIAGAQPISIRPYRHSPELKDELEKQINEMLASGVIRPSKSPFFSPTILVPKKGGAWRPCVDFRALNSLTVPRKFPIPVIEELLDELHGAQWFSKLDLRAGYHQIRLATSEEYKTAFQTHCGHFEYMVMPFGLAGAPATFQGAMNNTLQKCLRKYVLVFFDDILIYSASYEDHLKHIAAVLQLLQADDWKVKLSKCSFGQRQISYLGYNISGKRVSTQPEKIQDVQKWPTPTNLKELMKFLVFAGYYRRFCHHYGIIARPLTNLLKKNTQFCWTSETDKAFTTLKELLTTATILALPNFSQKFILETDACDTGIGAVLQQGGQPIAYLSRPLCPKMQGLSTYEKEFPAIILAVEHWRTYLQHAEFTIYTDHKSLIHFEEQRLHTPWQKKAFTKLLGLQYRICYKKRGRKFRCGFVISQATPNRGFGSSYLYSSTILALGGDCRVSKRPVFTESNAVIGNST